jgi:predicted ATPase
MRIEAAAFRNFPPFADGVVTFPVPSKTGSGGTDDVHLFTGENGTGKTRLLCLLAAACGGSKELDDRCPPRDDDRHFVLGLARNTTCFWDRKRNVAVWPFRNDPSFLLRPGIDVAEVRGRDSSSAHSIIDAAGGQSKLVTAMAFQGAAKIKEAPISPLETVRPSDSALNLSFSPDDGSQLCQLIANMKREAVYVGDGDVDMVKEF